MTVESIPASAGSRGTPLVEMQDVSIAFGGIKAVDHATIDLYPGEVVGLLGHNGAGKSTLMSILYGFYRADSGQILINGTPTTIPDSQSAIRAGIGMVFQHFKLVQNFTVLENVILGVEEGALLRPSLANQLRNCSTS